MNYIKHLNLTFERISLDDRLNAYHVSLYLVLFQEWNSHRFANKIFIFRAEMMRNSKIRSKTTYLRCLRDLHSWGYIIYFPSKDSHKGSIVQMLKPTKVVREELAADPENSEKDFQESEEPNREALKTVLSSALEDHEMVLDRTREDQGMILRRTKEDQEMVLPSSIEDHKMVLTRTKEDHEMVPLLNIIKHKQKKYNIPESEKEVIDFFRLQKWLPLEGIKFYHHYNSIGWKKGGAVELTDWKSAATMWAIRAKETRPKRSPFPRYPQRDNLKVTKIKDYDQPL